MEPLGMIDWAEITNRHHLSACRQRSRVRRRPEDLNAADAAGSATCSQTSGEAVSAAGRPSDARAVGKSCETSRVSAPRR